MRVLVQPGLELEAVSQEQVELQQPVPELAEQVVALEQPLAVQQELVLAQSQRQLQPLAKQRQRQRYHPGQRESL